MEVVTWHKNVNTVIIGKAIIKQQKQIVIKQENTKNTMMTVIAENLQKNKYIKYRVVNLLATLFFAHCFIKFYNKINSNKIKYML